MGLWASSPPPFFYLSHMLIILQWGGFFTIFTPRMTLFFHDLCGFWAHDCHKNSASNGILLATVNVVSSTWDSSSPGRPVSNSVRGDWDNEGGYLAGPTDGISVSCPFPSNIITTPGSLKNGKKEVPFSALQLHQRGAN